MQLVIRKTIIHERSQLDCFVYIFGVLHKKMISHFSTKSTAEIWFSVFVLQISEKKQKGGNKSHSSLHFFQKQIRSLPDWQHPAARRKNWSNVFRQSVTLTEEVDTAVLRAALETLTREKEHRAAKDAPPVDSINMILAGKRKRMKDSSESK